MSHLYVDGQLFQTGAWFRGMGKITVEYLRAMEQRADFSAAWEMTLILSEQLRDAEREQAIKKAFPRAELVFLDLQVHHETVAYPEAAAQNKRVLDEYFASRPGAVYFIPALLEHAIYPVFPAAPKKLLLFHDLIPLLFADVYLHNEDLRRQYFERFGEIFISDHILANSDTTRDDLVRFLSVEPEKVTAVYGGGFDRSEERAERPQGLADKPIIFMPTGDDYRKNNLRCVQAFQQFNQARGNKYQLVLTSGFGEGTQRQLRAITPDVHFAGVVKETEYRWLFHNCEAVFYGPEYEGWGLPLLEAMAEGVERIVCSDIGVFREIAADEPVVFCDPKDPADMAKALERVLRTKPAKRYRALETFTWEHSGLLFFAVLQQLDAAAPAAAPKPRIAIVGPDPRGHSSIGKFIQELHPATSRIFDCDYYFEMSALTPGMPKASFLPYVARHYDIRDLNAEAYAGYDAVWYHLGNSDFHIETIKRALSYPGYVVLHDTRLRGLFDQLEQRNHIARSRYDVELAFGGLREAECITSLVNSARGVLVHSDDAREKVLHELITDESSNIVRLYHPMTLGAPQRKGNAVTIGFGGFTTPRPDDIGMQLLQEMLHDERFKDCTFKLFGSGFNYSDDNALVADLRNDPRVTIAASLSDLAFQNTLASLDMLMNYRVNYFGETSRFALEAMRYGVCVLVRDVGWYHDLPAGTACKVAERGAIVEAAAGLVQDKEARRAMAEAAREFVGSLTPQAYARTMQQMQQTNMLGSLPAAYRQAWSVALGSQLPASQAQKIKEVIDD